MKGCSCCAPGPAPGQQRPSFLDHVCSASVISRLDACSQVPAVPEVPSVPQGPQGPSHSPGDQATARSPSPCLLLLAHPGLPPAPWTHQAHSHLQAFAQAVPHTWTLPGLLCKLCARPQVTRSHAEWAARHLEALPSTQTCLTPLGSVSRLPLAMSPVRPLSQLCRCCAPHLFLLANS